ncbi:MAG: hypothetical protein ACI945_001745, partial [Pseudohongiellaceae bacterium]
MSYVFKELRRIYFLRVIGKGLAQSQNRLTEIVSAPKL